MGSNTGDSDPASAEPQTPSGEAIYAVGDVHGRLDLLEDMQALIRADAAARPAARRTIVYLGDYVDRGPDSRGVVARLLDGPPEGFEQICLLGNHEAWLLRFLEDADVGAGWIMNGGDETMASYGARPPRLSFGRGRLEATRAAFAAAMPPDHLEFLKGLRLMWRAGDYVFAHAGVRPGVALSDQDPGDLIWIRHEFLDADDDFGAVVVHGHTIVEAPERRSNRIGIDTGAFATGRLTCLVLDGGEQTFLHT